MIRRISPTLLLALLPLAAGAGCGHSLKDRGFLQGPVVASTVEIELPVTVDQNDPITVPPGKAVLVRVPATGKNHFNVLIGGYDGQDAVANFIHMDETYNGDVSGPAIEILNGWGYFFSYGYRPRGRGHRIAPVGAGTEFLLWTDRNGTPDPDDDVERVFLIKSDDLFDGDRISVTRDDMPETKVTILKPGNFAAIALTGGGDIKVNPKPSKSDTVLADFLDTVEKTVVANGLPWTLKPLQ